MYFILRDPMPRSCPMTYGRGTAKKRLELGTRKEAKITPNRANYRDKEDRRKMRVIRNKNLIYWL